MDQRSAPTWLRVVAVALLALFVASCAQSAPAPTQAPAAPKAAAPTEAPKPAQAQPTTAPAAQAQPTTAPAAQKPAESKAADSSTVLRIVTQSPIQFIKPWAEGGDTNRHYIADVFLPPLRRNPDGKFEPGFALSAEPNADETEWTLKIDPKAVFSNGKSITAKGIKAAWEYGATPDQAAPWGGHLTVIGNVVGMKEINQGKATEAAGLIAKDDQTLVLKLTQPTPGFRNAFGSYLLGAVDVDAAKANPDGWMTKPPASGPYQLEWFRDDNRIELTPNPKWWGTPAVIKKVVIQIVPDPQTRLIAYENNEVDIMKDTGILGPQLIAKHKDELVPVPSTGIFFVAPNTTVPPFDDAKVRQAFLMAIDRKGVFKVLFPHFEVADRILLNSYPCYDTTKIEIKYDPARAKQLLAESKYGGPDKLPPITFHFYASIEVWDRVFAAFQQQWKQNLGVDVKLNSVPSGQQYDKDAQAKRLSFGSPLVDPGPYLQAMGASDGSVNNTGGFIKDAEIDQWLKDGNAVPGSKVAERCALYNKAEQKLVDQALIWPMYVAPYYWVVKPNVKGFSTTINQDIRSLASLTIQK